MTFVDIIKSKGKNYIAGHIKYYTIYLILATELNG